MDEQEALIRDLLRNQENTPHSIHEKYPSIRFPEILRIKRELEAEEPHFKGMETEMLEVGSDVVRLEKSADVALEQDVYDLATNLTRRANVLIKNATLGELVPIAMVLEKLAVVQIKMSGGNDSKGDNLDDFTSKD